MAVGFLMRCPSHRCYHAKTSTPKAINIHEMIAAIRQDPTLQAVTKAMDKGDWFKFSNEPCIDTDIYNVMEKVKHELTLITAHGIILKGTRIVMPTTLQQRVIVLAQEASKRKSMVSLHEQHGRKKTSSCGACQIATPWTTKKTLQMSPLPASNWREVSVDFKQLSSCKYLLVITDDYSCYPVVEPIRSTSASTVILQLNKTFSTFGIPEIVRSDNGPPFNGRKFREFAQTLGFKYRKVTPVMDKSEWSS